MDNLFNNLNKHNNKEEVKASKPYPVTCCRGQHDVLNEQHWIENLVGEIDQEESTEKEYVIPRTLVPSIMAIANSINNHHSTQILKVIFDSGGSATLIHKKELPTRCVPSLMTQPIKSKTVEGTFESKRMVQMNDIILPEFDHNKNIDGQKALVFSGSTNYDIIFGRDFLSMIG